MDCSVHPCPIVAHFFRPIPFVSLAASVVRQIWRTGPLGAEFPRRSLEARRGRGMIRLAESARRSAQRPQRGTPGGESKVMSAATLLVIQGVDQGARFEIPEGEVGLGRGVQNVIRVHDTEVSRAHANLI